jgi:calcineurin-like phosphoesterase family protein
VSLCKVDNINWCTKQLKGRKILVTGNHDGGYTTTFWNRLFIEVNRTPLIHNGIIYSHEPVNPNYMLKYKSHLNIHGHTHSKFMDDSRYVCVSLEQINFKPIESSSIVNLV